MPIAPVPRLCLNMIVRNEEARIVRCLRSLRPWIHSFCILDTGSTDSTLDLIREELGELPGYIGHVEFTSFGQARNAALKEARDLPFSFDYLLLVDADMELLVEDEDWLMNLPRHAAFEVQQRAPGGERYNNVRLVSRNHNAQYVGSTHEYLSTRVLPTELKGIYFRDHADGANRDGKFKRDIAMLSTELYDAHRPLFYLAQSYRDDGQHEKAAAFYRARAELGGWPEEAYVAKLNEARCYRRLGLMAEFVEAAIEAWHLRPERLEAIADLTRHFREDGRHAAALTWAAPSMTVKAPDDRLFVEPDAYGPLGSIAEDFSISAFYFATMRDMGATVCDHLATMQACREGRRAVARFNLRHYARTIADLLAATTMQATVTRLAPPLEEGWHALNPSVAVFGGELVVNVRAVNYEMRDDGGYALAPDGYALAPDGVVRTRNYLTYLTPSHGGLEPHGWHELQSEDCLQPSMWGWVRGLEDVRLFTKAGGRELWFTACVRELNAEGWCQQYVGQIGGTRLSGVTPGVVYLRRISAEQPTRHEKNWTPAIDDGGNTRLALYDYDGAPPRWLDGTAMIGDEARSPDLALDHLRGGSQAIAFDGGYLSVTHEVVEDGLRHYLHRFVYMGADLTPLRVSVPFKLHGQRIEFVAGLAFFDEDTLVLSYGVGDREAYLMQLPVAFVRRMVGL